MSTGDIPPLPSQLERGAVELRQREPSAAFEERLARALSGATQSSPAPSAPRYSVAPWLVPLTAAALLAVRVGGEAIAGEETLLTEEHDVELDGDGIAWVDVDLDTHRHDTTTVVRFDTPQSMDLRVGRQASPLGEASCAAARCSHRFRTQRRGQRVSVRLGVSQRGTHRVEVMHRSRSHVVREHIIVHAH